MRITSSDTGLRILIPTTRPERMRGLRGREPAAMLFERARSVHTFGMRAPIVVAFLDRDYVVLRVRTVRPRRIVVSPRARHILEAPVGTSLRPGMCLAPARETLRRARPGAATSR